ncbi:MAG: acyl-CoA thioesterase [Gammaproteobacteria bacterium]|nr:MAG: acyl-CoA thioesterase [Gammaproteobacteria bacterium]
MPLRWRDLDAFNHVNNATFLSYLEETRIHWMTGLEGAWRNEATSPILAATSINYRRQLGWPGEIVVQLIVERLGTTSLTFGQRIVDARDRDILYADGTAVLVWIETASGRPVPLPEAIRKACA